MIDGLNRIIAQILKDISIDMADEFDKNFERQAFFSEAWQRRKTGTPRDAGRAILTDTGELRRSIQCTSTTDSVRFFTTLPYAAIHNEGGEIKVTAKMKRFFWHKYYSAAGSFGRKKNGELRKDKRNARLSSDSEFWKWMALKKVGTSIVIPRRRFLGYAPEVERAIKSIIESNLEEYFQSLDAKDLIK